MYVREKAGKEKFPAVDHISLKAHQGEIIGILGPNGLPGAGIALSADHHRNVTHFFINDAVSRDCKAYRFFS